MEMPLFMTSAHPIYKMQSVQEVLFKDAVSCSQELEQVLEE